MKLKEIMQLLEEFCPRSFAMSWDNAGLQVGGMQAFLDNLPDPVRVLLRQQDPRFHSASPQFAGFSTSWFLTV